MPSQFDNTYHFEYSKPTYDTPEEEAKFKVIREADHVFELRAPREPNREEELEYLDWLTNEFRTDPWFTLRFRKYMANPKRWAWKNQRESKNQYQFTFWTNAIIGGFMTAPFAIWVGRRAQRYQGGVPIVPQQRMVHDFVNLDPGYLTRKTFRWYFFGTCFIGGMTFAWYTVKQGQKNDGWYSRPDLRPFPAMVPRESMDLTERTMLETHYQSFRNKQYSEDKKNRTWYRLLFPNDANFEAKQNPYQQTHRENVYNPANNYYARPSNHLRHHTNE